MLRVSRGLRFSSTAMKRKADTAMNVVGGEAVTVPLFINNKLVPSAATEWVPVRCPATQVVLARTPISTRADMESAVDAARAAFPAWSRTSVSNRARVMLKLQALVRERSDDLARLISSEHGKTFEDAKGDVFRGLEIVEHACSVPSLMMGETLAGVGTDVDTHSYRVPLGVCAGIVSAGPSKPRPTSHTPAIRVRRPTPPTHPPSAHPRPNRQAPFNFPAMIPLWMFPLAVTTGNTYVLKPSERVPLTTMLLAELTKEAGLPDGVLNIIHGTLAG